MAQSPGDAAEHLPAARAGSREALGQVLEACRPYLLRIANEGVAVDVQAKGGASDLVQETFLEAQRDFARFQGNTEAELLPYLRRGWALWKVGQRSFLVQHRLSSLEREIVDTDARMAVKAAA